MTETLSSVLPDRVERMAHDLLTRLCDAGLTVATAESCTGGLLASLLTDVDGASHAFDRGFVVYTEAAKHDLLGVATADLDRFGAVSREVALAMTTGALNACTADIALSITGFAGPGAPGDEPGLVHLACQRRGRAPSHREERFGDVGRGPVRIASIAAALEMLSATVGDA